MASSAGPKAFYSRIGFQNELSNCLSLEVIEPSEVVVTMEGFVLHGFHESPLKDVLVGVWHYTLWY